jgi:hypothetical protein
MSQRKHRAVALIVALSTFACGGADGAALKAPGQAMGERSHAPLPAMDLAAVPPAAPAPVPGAPSTGAPSTDAATHHAAGPSGAGASARSAKSEAPVPGKSVLQTMLIYTGALTTSVDTGKGSAAVDEVVGIAEALGGHIASRSDGNVTVKVPSAHFREAMTALERVGEVRSRHVTAQDVTEEFHDLDVRLQNLKATRKRLEEFLTRAGNMQEALTVERELERVAQEMDRLEGRLHFLRSQASLSTISVGIVEKPPVVLQMVKDTPPPPPPPPPPARLLDVPVSWISELEIARLSKTR